ncbi:hypothetical protein OM076_34075 [Solirubrobacter ginsenosidimutans]|uniref:Uncharacterized protein n=1 Tax=Solirubrobacter ginsenosidimutans TaxID=490573 RepID=A0A9X3S590_9ACTN|nr:hypothetical protein [Solirubrobacter ginsenosidimutans]MDA0165347.1 hypothetical protein [Solirubrobacter ginsenosidimutans]
MWALLLPVALVGFTLLTSACGVAMRKRKRPWLSGWLAMLAVIAMGAFLVIPLHAHDPNVSSGAFVWSIVLATVGLGVLPVVAFYSLGYWLADWLVVGIAACVLALPLAPYLLFGLIWTIAASGCPPDAYECPF